MKEIESQIACKSGIDRQWDLYRPCCKDVKTKLPDAKKENILTHADKQEFELTAGRK